MFNDKSILITGGTGSFGKQYVKTILSLYKPHRLIVYSRDELKQYEMQNSQIFQTKKNSSILRYLIGDVRDKERLNWHIFSCWIILLTGSTIDLI